MENQEFVGNLSDQELENILKERKSLKRRIKFRSLKDGWYVLRYSVLFRITYEIENLIILTDNLERFVPKGIFQKLLKLVLSSKRVYAWLKKIRISLKKKMIFNESTFYRKRTVNKERLNRAQRKLKRSIEKMSREELTESLSRAYEIQKFRNNLSNNNFVEKCQTILSEKLK